MKKQFLFAALAIATLFTACSKEEELSKNEGTTPVNFVIGGIGARTATTLSEEVYSTVFEANDQIGIYATGGATIKNQLLTVTAGEDETLTLTGDAIEYEQGLETTFKAYYPYVEGNGETVTMTVGDQANGIDNYDFVIATPDAISTETQVTLNFQHKLAMVQVQVAGSIGETATSVTLKNVKPSVTWNVEANSFGEAYGEAIDITMYRIDSTNNIYVALVPVQTITNSAAMFSTTIGNKIYTFKPNSEVSLTANQVSKFKITIAEKVEMATVSIGNFNIAGWTYSESVFEDFEEPTEETVPAIELISTTAGTIGENTILTVVQNRTEITNEGWYAYKEANITSTIEKVDNSFHLKSVSNEGWNKRCLIYRVAADKIENSANKVFNLNFIAKASATGNLRIVVSDANNTKFFDVNSGQTPNRYLSISNTEFPENNQTNQTVTVNFKKYSTANNAVPSVDATNDVLDDIIVAITPGADDIDFYIKDITLIEVQE